MPSAPAWLQTALPRPPPLRPWVLGFSTLNPKPCWHQTPAPPTPVANLHSLRDAPPPRVQFERPHTSRCLHTPTAAQPDCRGHVADSSFSHRQRRRRRRLRGRRWRAASGGLGILEGSSSGLHTFCCVQKRIPLQKCNRCHCQILHLTAISEGLKGYFHLQQLRGRHSLLCH